jgi:FPC/CPF motif-containing protein YcgG
MAIWREEITTKSQVIPCMSSPRSLEQDQLNPSFCGTFSEKRSLSEIE